MKSKQSNVTLQSTNTQTYRQADETEKNYYPHYLSGNYNCQLPGLAAGIFSHTQSSEPGRLPPQQMT